MKEEIKNQNMSHAIADYPIRQLNKQDRYNPEFSQYNNRAPLNLSFFKSIHVAIYQKKGK